MDPMRKPSCSGPGEESQTNYAPARRIQRKVWTARQKAACSTAGLLDVIAEAEERGKLLTQNR
eukprot:5717246-Prorocentrum_lima.AAC.1